MAIQARPGVADSADASTTAEQVAAAALSAHRPGEPVRTPPAVYAGSARLERLLGMVPLTFSIVLSSLLFWMPLFEGSANLIAVGITAFLAYWALRSYITLAGCLISLRKLATWARRDWAAEYRVWQSAHPEAEPWDWPRHLIVIPNYKEDESGLRRLLASLAAQGNARQLSVVLAMEEREAGAERKAAGLLLEFGECFAECFATYHPSGLRGEAPGKGSNEAWGLRRAYDRLIAGIDSETDRASELARYTVTSCDADSIFAPTHFVAMNYLFLTAGDRYRSFWQPAISNSNNIWDIPSVLRIMEGLGTVNRLASLSLPITVPFPTSCYTLSWQMLHTVDYWDEEVIPEDWHIFMKCSLTLGDRVRMYPMFIPIGNDCVLTDGYLRTLRARYLQTVRHAFGCVDMAYAWRGFWRRPSPLGRRRGFALAFSMTYVHAMWASQWFFVTLGAAVPGWMATHLDAPMPAWWLERPYTLPIPSLHLSALFAPERWLVVGTEGLFDPLMHLSLPGLLVASCLIPLVSLIAIELHVRGGRPAHVSRLAYARQFLVWPLMAPITLVWGAIPAFHAQWRLASGRGLVYRVAEKGTRESVRHAMEPDTARALAAVSHTVLFPGEELRHADFGREPFIV